MEEAQKAPAIVISDTHPLADALRRWEFSRHRFRQMQEAIDKYRETEPFAFENGHDGEDVILTFTEAKPLPALIRFLAGEAVHHLRCVLDHVAFIISSRSHEATWNPDRVQFPIYDIMSDFEAKRKNKVFMMFCESDREQILQLAPAGDGYRVFWMLNKLNNMDKHKLPITAKLKDVEIPFEKFGLFDEDKNPISVIEYAPSPWQVGQVVARAPRASVKDFFCSIPAQIVIDLPEDGEMDLEAVLRRMGEDVLRVIEIFAHRMDHDNELVRLERGQRQA